jgi:hypothetical protein
LRYLALDLDQNRSVIVDAIAAHLRRNGTERMLGRLKDFRRIATRLLCVRRASGLKEDQG